LKKRYDAYSIKETKLKQRGVNFHYMAKATRYANGTHFMN